MEREQEKGYLIQIEDGGEHIREGFSEEATSELSDRDG